MKGGKSSGIDDIDSYSLKTAAPVISDVLLHLINLALTKQTFPSEWKTQLIHPNYKNPELRSCGPLFEIVGRVVLSCSKKVIIQKTVENRIG